MDVAIAAAHFGSRTKLAEALGISPSAVSQWGDVVPVLRQYQIERLTGGSLKALTIATSKASQEVGAQSPNPDGSVRESSAQAGAA